jgi:hypothetical protein
MDFGRKPSDWEGRWQMSKDRERQKELRLARGLPAQVPLRHVVLSLIAATAILAAVTAVAWFAFGENVGMVVLLVGIIAMIGFSRTWT